MKKITITLLALLATTGFAFSQALPNAGMENWNNSGDFEDAAEWGSFNNFSIFAPGFPITVEKSTDAHAGQYAAKIKTVAADPDYTNFPELQQIFPSDTISGLLLSGDFLEGVFGLPVTERPLSFDFYSKYTTPGADSAAILIQVLNYDAQAQESNVIGQGLGFLTNTPNYGQFSIPIQYLNQNQADSIAIFFFSSAGGLTTFGLTGLGLPIPGSELLVDDVSIVYEPNSVADNASNKFSFKMYPNPVQNELSILTTGHQFANAPLTVEFYDMTGRIVQSTNVNQIIQKVDVNTLASGMYIYAVKTGNDVLSTGKFTVAK